jgi:hypothetical protein
VDDGKKKEPETPKGPVVRLFHMYVCMYVCMYACVFDMYERVVLCVIRCLFFVCL